MPVPAAASELYWRVLLISTTPGPTLFTACRTAAVPAGPAGAAAEEAGAGTAPAPGRFPVPEWLTCKVMRTAASAASTATVPCERAWRPRRRRGRPEGGDPSDPGGYPIGLHHLILTTLSLPGGRSPNQIRFTAVQFGGGPARVAG